MVAHSEIGTATSPEPQPPVAADESEDDGIEERMTRIYK
jgi:hypothetical protein